jgi:2-methylisocitrate lyase-like PEP mutase family enzyme
MPTPAEKADAFLALHRSAVLLMPNPWDVGSAKVLQSLGFSALATTSGGFAASLGRLDGSVTRDEAISHGHTIALAVDVPVSADLENCFADDPAGVAVTVEMAVGAGLAGCSVEDFSRTQKAPIYELSLARDRVEAAAETAHRGPIRLVLTARAENHLRGVTDLDDTITRLQAYQEAGADVLFAPGLSGLDDIRRVVSSVDRPVNVLVRAGAPTVAQLAEIGVSRISVGSAFAWAAYGGLVEAAQKLMGSGTYGYFDRVGVGWAAARPAFEEG